MQVVSNAWKQAQLENILPPTDIEIKYAATDIDAMDHATITSNSVSSEVTSADMQSVIHNGVFRDTQALDLNKWELDGNTLFSDAYSLGYVSGYLSANDNTFSTAPTITLTFDSTRTIASAGVVIRFSTAYSEYATDFKVQSYLNSTLLTEATVTGNTSVEVEVAIALQNYNKIVITINKWCLPQAKARVESITIGNTKTFTKTDIISFKQNSESSLFSFSLPDYNIEFEFDNSDDEWNPDDPTGVYQSLAERQEVQVKYGYEINGAYEYISGGIYFLSEWQTPQNGITAKFKAKDLTIFMQNKFDASQYVGTSVSCYTLAQAAFTQSGIPTLSNGANRWVITDLASAPMPVTSDFNNYTCAEIVQLCCNATCCVMRYGRDGIMYCEHLNTLGQTYEINRFNSYQDAEYNTTQQLRGISINNGEYAEVYGTNGETQYINNPLLNNADVGEAQAIIDYTKNHLTHRRIVSGQYRVDPRIDVLDYVTVKNKFATMSVVMTRLNFAYNGMFTATYEGRAE